jgi:hypothetical protein
MTFYDSEAVEYDLELISSLTNGKSHLTNQAAKKIYYRIKADNIKFKSDTGEQFINRLLNAMTDEQVEDIENNIANKRKKMRNRRINGRRIIMINGRISIVMTVLVLVFILVASQWERISTGTKQTVAYVNGIKSYSDKVLEDYNKNEQEKAQTKASKEAAKEAMAQEAMTQEVMADNANDDEVIVRDDEEASEEETVDITALSNIEDFELSDDGTILYKYTGDSVLVDIPKTVTTIEDDAFDNLESVRGIMLPLSIEKVESGAFSGLHDGMIIYVYDAGTTNTINCAKKLADTYEQLVYGEHLDIETVENIIGIDYGID